MSSDQAPNEDLQETGAADPETSATANEEDAAMLAQLITAIANLETPSVTVSDTVDPANVARCVCVSQYMAASFYGDDANVLDVPKVQLDVYTTSILDQLPDEICGLLADWHLPYTLEDRGYDADTNRIRTILQAEVI